MRLPKFEYHEPKTLKEAARALASDAKRSVLLGGGTDLLVNMKHRVIEPKRVINLKTIPKLSYISNRKDGLRIGALTTLCDLASSREIQERFPILSQVSTKVGAYALQAMGTLGGNLCQGNRCRFYNQSAFWRGAKSPCYKAGGKLCHVVRKPGECHSTYCGDMAPVLIALEAKVRVVGPNGERVLPLNKLYTEDGKKPLSLKNGEILKEVLLPLPSGKTLYLKWRRRESVEFPIVSLALHIEKDRTEKIKKARIIFSAVGPGPVETAEAEKMLESSSLDNRTIERVSNQAVKEISPMRTSIYSPSYKRRIAGILLRQALEELMDEHNAKCQGSKFK
ncbi:MAG TPA: xanthine dehydrogenase family protein subunit M [Thermodesulfobacteriota bacterium]|nr:xanthine dehydrogenase family protein subunit M [Thermodesulfobacteriota bacterium]